MSSSLNKTNAVVIGLEENGLGVVRALAHEKIPCICVTGPDGHAAWKTNSSRIIRTREWSKEVVIDNLIQLGQSLTTKAPLLITMDEPVLWISESRSKLEPFFEINLPCHDTVNLLMDKRLFTQMAIKEGWPIPTTWFINNYEQLIESLMDITYPCILKPATKNHTFRKYSLQKVYKIYKEDELIKTYKMVSQWEKETVIQEWIEGGDERIAFCLGYYNRQSLPLALFVGRKLRQFPIECGNTAISEPAPKIWGKRILDVTNAIFEKVGYTGLGSVEFKMRIGSDEPLIMEPTVGRTNYQNEIAVLNGQNIPVIAYFDLARDLQFPAACNLRSTKLIDGRNERRAAWNYFRQNRLSIFQWLRDRRGPKKYMLLRATDTGPIRAVLMMRVSRLYRKGIKIIRSVCGLN